MNISKLAWVAVLCLTFGLTGCGRKVPDAEFDQLFSRVYKEFKVDIWTAGGKAKIEDQKKTGSWNPKTKRGSNQLRGILTVSGEGTSCTEILKLVDQFVQTRTGSYHIEGDIPSSITGEQQHIHTMWMYNWEKRHGELHVWLFPYPDGKRIAFAVYHYETKRS